MSLFVVVIFVVPWSNCSSDLNVGLKKLSGSKVQRERRRHGGLDCNSQREHCQ